MKATYIRILAFTILTFAYRFVDAQIIEGKIIDSDTKEPIAFANIFFSGTLVGTTSDIDGSFFLSHQFEGNYDLIVSYVGYEEYMASLDSVSNLSFLTINLIPDVKTLSEVEVTADSSGWKNNFEAFKPLFLGETLNAQKTKIINPKDIFLFFDKQYRSLFAHSRKEVIIENEALGYQINYIIKEFEMNYSSGIFYSYGIPRFQAMTPRNNRQSRRWTKNRLKTYNGSFQHFLNALKSNTIQEEGFEISEIHKVHNRKRPSQTLIDEKLAKFKTTFLSSGVSISNSTQMDSMRYWRRMQKMPVTVDSIGISHTNNSLLLNDQGYFTYKGYLKIIYKNEPEELAFRPGNVADNKQTTDVQVFDQFLILENGYYDVKKVFFTGYMSWVARLADMLPLEYQPTND